MPRIAHRNRPRGANPTEQSPTQPNPSLTLDKRSGAQRISIFTPFRSCEAAIQSTHRPPPPAASCPMMSQPRPRPRSRPGRRRRRLQELGVNADDPRAAMADPEQQPPAGDGRPLSSSTSSSPPAMVPTSSPLPPQCPLSASDIWISSCNCSCRIARFLGELAAGKTKAAGRSEAAWIWRRSELLLGVWTHAQWGGGGRSGDAWLRTTKKGLPPPHRLCRSPTID
jgi:hypothetical protein